jgi:predicted glycosyltransferase
VLSSIRDILGGGQGNAQRQQKMLDAFERYFDHVLVHGDPKLIALDATYDLAPALGSRLHYTGYVVDPAVGRRASGDAGCDEVLVSAGGGAVGMALLDAAIRARPLTGLRGRTWRVLAGENLPEEQFKRLVWLAGELGQGKVQVERARADFVAMLGRCALSISQGGYNTVLELLSQGTRAVVVPFSAGGNEIEQSMRARLLASKGWLHCVEEDALTPQGLAAAVDQAMQAPVLPAGQIRLDGAQQTVALMQVWLRQRRALAKEGRVS